MRKTLLICRFFLVILAASMLSGCAMFITTFMEYGKLEDSARTAYLAGNYDSAVFIVVNSLKLEPTYDKSQELVKLVFPMAVDRHLSKIEMLNTGNVKFKWDTVVSEYEALLKLNGAIKSLPVLTDEKTKGIIKFNITSYSRELSEAKNSAAEAHYHEGVLLSKRGTSTREQAAKEFTTANTYVSGYKDAIALAAEGYYREGLKLIKQDDVNTQRQAAKEFKKAMSFVSSYKDSDALYEKARKGGTKRIAIIPFEDKTGKMAKYGALAETAADQIISKIMNDQSAMEFLEIISRNQLENVMREQKLGLTGTIDETTAISLGKVLGIHEIITGKITGVIYKPERTINKEVGQKARVVVGEERYRDKKGNERTRNVWGDVHATAIISTRTAGASVNGSYNIIDIKTARIIKTKAFTGKADFKSEWGRFRGDERAIKGEIKNLCSKNEEVPPSEDELVNNSIKQLSNTLADEIIAYAK